MRKILIYLKDYKKETILAPVFKMLEASFELLVPLVVASMIDVGIAGGNRGYLIRMGLLLVGLGIVGLGCSITAQFFSAKAAVGFAAKLRHELFAHIQGLSFSNLDQIGSPTLITRMTSDINQVQAGVNTFLRLILRSPFLVLGAMVMAFIINARAGIIFAVTIGILSAIVFFIMRTSIPLFQKIQGQLDRLLGITRENLSGVRIIRAFHQEDEEVEIFQEENQELTAMQIFTGKISAFLNPLTFAVLNLGLIWLLFVGASQADAGILVQGQVVALVNYLSQILLELIKFANLIFAVNKSIASGNRIEYILEVKSDRGSKSGAFAPWQSSSGNGALVEFQNVSLRYENAGSDSLKGISFSANSGELIGIIGGTGSGKTSLINLIPRFYEASSGNILVNSKDVKEQEVSELREKIAVVPQKAWLFQGSIRENLMWGNQEATEDKLNQVVDIAQARSVVEEAGKGLKATVVQGGKNFSGGQKQRLSIARALVRDSEILILDDSFSALDYATEARLWYGILKMKKRPLIFAVSGRVSTLRHVDKILVLDDGEMVGFGSHEDLLKDCGVYREIYESQKG